MHRHGNRQRTDRNQIIHDRGNGVDADVGVVTFPGKPEHLIGDQIFCAKPLFDMGEISVGGFDQVSAFAANAGRFGKAVGG